MFYDFVYSLNIKTCRPFPCVHSTGKNETYTFSFNIKDALLICRMIIAYAHVITKGRKKPQSERFIQNGEYVPMLEEHPSIFAYKRILADDEMIVYNNFFGESTEISIEGDYDVILSNYKRTKIDATILLQPYESLVILKRR